MRTTKPISTVSFNTPAYLKQKLDELTTAGIISFWAFIIHEPEDDEAGLKKHQHVYIEPSKMLQTDNIKTELQEYDPEKPDKPKGCITFKSSKFDHWYMYILHDKKYLASKGQSRRFHYHHDEIITSDRDDLQFKARSIDLLALSPYADMLEAQNNGLQWDDYFKRGNVPIPYIRQFRDAWFTLLSDETERNGYENHPNDNNADENGGMDALPSAVVAGHDAQKNTRPITPAYTIYDDEEMQEVTDDDELPF